MPVYADTTVTASKVKRVFFCNGQFYYDVKARRDELKRDVSILVCRISLLLESNS